MGFLTDVIAWITTNGPTVVNALVYMVGAAALIARLTPWTEDDTIVGKIQSVLNFIGQRAGYLPPSMTSTAKKK